MSLLSYEVQAPPMTRNILLDPAVKVFFADVLYSALQADAQAAESGFAPLKPNNLLVVPYLTDGAVKYVLASCVDLAQDGMVQRREHVVQTTWNTIGITDVLGVKDCDTNQLIVPAIDRYYEMAFTMIQAGYAIELQNTYPDA